MTDRRWTRPVVLFMVAASASAGGAMGIGTVVGLQIYDLTRSTFALGVVGIAQFAPALVLVLVTGSVADRYDRARVFSLGLFGQTIAVTGLALYARGDASAAAPIYLLVVVFGTARAFSTSAQSPLVADLVPRDQLPWLIPRRTLITRASGIAAPIAAGALYVVDPMLSYVVMAGMLLVAGIAAIFIPAMPPAAAPSAPNDGWKQALEGWHFVRRSPILFSAITIDLFAVLFGGAVALLPALAEERLGVNGTGVGILRGAGGLGAGLAALALAVRPLTSKVGVSLIGAVAVFGMGTMVLGLTRSFEIAVLAMIVLSAADGLSVYIRQALVPLLTPREKMGRVSALSSVSIGASNELGAFESGVAGQLLGVSAAIALGGVATVAIAGAYAIAAPALRTFDRFPTRPIEEQRLPPVDTAVPAKDQPT